MADSVVYGPEPVTSAWLAWRSRIAPAISNKPPAFDGPKKNDGPKNDGRKMGGPENDGPEMGPYSRIECWAIASNNRTGAAAAPPAG